jgi:hypothetical protein
MNRHIKLIFFVSLSLFSCQSNKVNEERSILGVWQEVSSERPGFAMLDSSMVILDSFFFYGQRVDYRMMNDSLFFFREDGSVFSRSKIVSLTSDSLVTSDSLLMKTFFKVRD